MGQPSIWVGNGMSKSVQDASQRGDNRHMNRRIAATAASLLFAGGMLAASGLTGTAHAQTAYPTNYQTTNLNKTCSSLSKRISGTIRGYDGNAVNAYIGMDLNTTSGGKLVRIDGGGCSGSGAKLATYGITVHVNYQVTSSGVPAGTPDAVTTWYADVPGNTTNIYFEVTPKGVSSQPKYGNSMMPSVNITKNPQVISTLNLPVNKCGNLSTGSLKGWIYKGGKRV